MSYRKINLNGWWQLQPGEQYPASWDHQIEVPSLVDTATPQIQWENFNYFWYRKTVTLPEIEEGNHIILQLEQVKYGTAVYVNGQYCGGDIPCYTSQEFDITEYASLNVPNTIDIRIGRKHTLPKHSAVGNDYEKASFIPGIWGDASLHIHRTGRLNWVQILPDMQRAEVQINVETENFFSNQRDFCAEYRIREKPSQKVVDSGNWMTTAANGIQMNRVHCSVPDFIPWSPENPFLYQLEIELYDSGKLSDSQVINFGMREFEIRDGNFYLNGDRRVLLGSNIAFHRMLSDPSRKRQPWQEDWIKRVLVDIPKQHNIQSFRMHLGHAYNRWYDIADEYGILLHDEWMFWTSTASEEQIRREFTAWIRENCNHPSIVIWDPLNESEDERITSDIIPQLKEIDPTRPWEKVDFREDHPYIYSLGEVLNDREFGYTRSFRDLANSEKPGMVNEFGWWWLDWQDNPTELTKDVITRWLGPDYTKADLVERQSYLLTELIELFRRLDLDAIMPFVYLSDGIGATGNWFSGSLNEMRPKPVMTALKNALSLVGVSIELWDRHFVADQKVTVSVYLFNDTPHPTAVSLQLSLSGEKILSLEKKSLQITDAEHRKTEFTFHLPSFPGDYLLVAELLDDKTEHIATSKNPVQVFEPLQSSISLNHALTVSDPTGGITDYLHKHNVGFEELANRDALSGTVLINHRAQLSDYDKHLPQLTDFVRTGGVLVLQEPEYGITDSEDIQLLDELSLFIQYRKDPDRGGYDSYVFPTAQNSVLWENISVKHLQMFNGAVGGEIVSQHQVRPSKPFRMLAACNMHLRESAVMEIPYGDGMVIISRLQIRGRLLPNQESTGLYDRRYDPVAERYFRNLVASGYHHDKKNLGELIPWFKNIPYIIRVTATNNLIYDIDGLQLFARWGTPVHPGGEQILTIEFDGSAKIKNINIDWKEDFRKSVIIQSSDDENSWKTINELNSVTEQKLVLDLYQGQTSMLRIRYQNIDNKQGHTIWSLNINARELDSG